MSDEVCKGDGKIRIGIWSNNSIRNVGNVSSGVKRELHGSVLVATVMY